MSRTVDSIKFAKFLKKNLSKNNNKIKINKIKNLNIDNIYIHQIRIFNSSFDKKMNDTQKLCHEYIKEYPNNYFALNNIGNFYKEKKKINSALKYFLKAKNNYKKNDEFLFNLINFKKKLKFYIDKDSTKQKQDIEALKLSYIKIIIETYMFQLITISRPYFSEGFSNLKYLNDNLSVYIDTVFNKSIIKKVYKILKPYIAQQNLPKADYDNIFYNIGNCYQFKRKFNLAIKYYKLANQSENSNKYNSKILECYYLKKDKKKFINLSKKLKKQKKIDFNSLAICNYASKQLNFYNNYSFCKEPINNIVKFNLTEENKVDTKLLNQIKKDISSNRKHVNTPKVIGFKSLGNLYDIKSNSINRCKKIINECIYEYKKRFSEKNSILIKKWPKKFTINAWYIKLKKGGEVLPHIHDGWLSGVFYVKKIKNHKFSPTKDGELEVNYKFSQLKEFRKNLYKKIIYVDQGDLVLFPSSLPHRVVPYKNNNERISIAFDMKLLS